MTENWYAVTCWTSRAITQLQKLIDKYKVPARVVDPIVTRKMASGAGVKKVQERAFVGYTFIVTDEPIKENVLKAIEAINGLSIVNKRDSKTFEYIPLSKKDVALIQQVEEQELEIDCTVQVGMKVHVTEGPFSGFVGEVKIVDEDKGCVTIEILVFNRATQVEVPWTIVTPDSE